MTKKVTAITGGICSGKSVVADFLRKEGHIVIDCDVLAREVTEMPEIVEKIASSFGKEFFLDGKLNRAMLASFIFSDETRTRQLNEITHPKILQLLSEKLNKLDGKVFVEVTLINSPGLTKLFDEVWVVTANKEERLSRLTKRNCFNVQQAENIISRQPDYDELLTAKQFPVKTIQITNNSDFLVLEKNVKRLL